MSRGAGKIREGDRLLLYGQRSYFTTAGSKDFHTDAGAIKLRLLLGRRYGTAIRSSKGEKFVALQPTATDFLLKAAGRGPQIMTVKDCALIAGFAGARSGWRVVDAGTGSAFFALFMANIVGPSGRVYTYEARKDFYDIAKRNIENSGLSGCVETRNRDISKGIRERGVDMVQLDLPRPEKIIPIAAKALRPGGWLAVYSPCIEQVMAAHAAIAKLDFCQPRTFEALVRDYKVIRGYTRPMSRMIAHTGYVTMARKAGK